VRCARSHEQSPYQSSAEARQVARRCTTRCYRAVTGLICAEPRHASRHHRRLKWGRLRASKRANSRRRIFVVLVASLTAVVQYTAAIRLPSKPAVFIFFSLITASSLPKATSPPSGRTLSHSPTHSYHQDLSPQHTPNSLPPSLQMLAAISPSAHNMSPPIPYAHSPTSGPSLLDSGSPVENKICPGCHLTVMDENGGVVIAFG